MFVGRLWYRRADGALASMDSKEERVVLLDSWLAMEEALGDLGIPQDVRVTPTLTSKECLDAPCKTRLDAGCMARVTDCLVSTTQTCTHTYHLYTCIYR